MEELEKKMQIFQKFFENLSTQIPSTQMPSAQIPLIQTPLIQIQTSSTQISSTQILPTQILPTPKPKQQYIKVEEILRFTNLTKNEYNNILV